MVSVSVFHICLCLLNYKICVRNKILSIGPRDLENDLNTFGYFFETLAIRDLRTYAEAFMSFR